MNLDSAIFAKQVASNINSLNLQTKSSKQLVDDFFQTTRIVFNIGHTTSGKPVSVFAKNHLCTHFIHCDPFTERNRIFKLLDNEKTSYRGYELVHRSDLEESDLFNWCSGHFPIEYLSSVEQRNLMEKQRYAYEINNRFNIVQSFGSLAYFKRKVEFSDSHGPEMFVVLFLGADWLLTYFKLWNTRHDKLYALVLSSNLHHYQYREYGSSNLSCSQNGLLYKLIMRANIAPKFLMRHESVAQWLNDETVVDSDETWFLHKWLDALAA